MTALEVQGDEQKVVVLEVLEKMIRERRLWNPGMMRGLVERVVRRWN
jgi:hypothetical protein